MAERARTRGRLPLRMIRVPRGTRDPVITLPRLRVATNMYDAIPLPFYRPRLGPLLFKLIGRKEGKVIDFTQRTNDSDKTIDQAPSSGYGKSVTRSSRLSGRIRDQTVKIGSEESRCLYV